MNEATISDVICRISVCEKCFNGNQMRSSLSVELREPRNISLHSDSRLFTSGFYKLFMTHRFLATPIARPSEPSSIYPGRKCGMYRKVLAHYLSPRQTILLRAICYAVEVAVCSHTAPRENCQSTEIY